jgi:chromosome segregation ATPase
MKLQAEIQDQRNKFFAMKREMENWRSECDNVTRHRSREVAALKEQHEKVERKLREENARLMDREIPQERDEQKLRLQGAEIQELTHLLKMARDEVKVARQGKEDAELALEQSISKREEVTAQFRAKIALVESQELSLEQQVHHAHAEVERKELLMRSMGRQVEEMTTQLEHVKKELSDAESRLATTIADQANAIGDLKAEFDVERNDLEHHIVQLQEKLYDREELVRRSQRIATEMQVRAEAVESELRKEHQYKIQEITKKLAAAELQLAEEKMTSKTAELKNKKEQEEIEAELDVLKSELARISREKDVLHEKVRELEGKLDGEKRATASIRRESTTMVRALEATVKELKYKVTDLEAKNLHAKTAEIDLQYSLQTVQGKLDGIQAENSAVIEALKNEARQRALEQDKLYAEKLEKIKENSRAVIEKEKKRADGYKGKAQDALKRGKLLSDTALAAAASSYGVLPVPTAGMTTEEMMAMTATLQLR